MCANKEDINKLREKHSDFEIGVVGIFLANVLIAILLIASTSKSFTNPDFAGAYEMPKKSEIIQKSVDEYSNYYFVVKIDGKKELMKVDFKDYTLLDQGEVIYINKIPSEKERSIFRENKAIFFRSYQESDRYIKENIKDNENMDKQRRIGICILIVLIGANTFLVIKEKKLRSRLDTTTKE